ncbi:MAG: multicopper oxidase domain-containing protein [Myxococcota bacterium]
MRRGGLVVLLGVIAATGDASAQDSSIRMQCPTATALHPTGDGIKCAHLVGGDGMVTMADDQSTPLYVFGFSPVPTGGPEVNSAEYPGWVMENGTLAANAPGPTIAVDEDDELFLTLTNAGMAMRPDLFDAHSVHWHGFPQAASIFDGVPDSSIAINMGASFTYYYNVKDAGTYLYHCHVEAAEHMQMGMLGNLYVRPRQNHLPDGTDLNGFVHHDGYTYAYNDGDGSTRYDVEFPVQISTFDPDFHDASFAVQPLPFAGMRDTYFMLNGRSYPDTTDPSVLSTVDPLGKTQYSQPVSTLISATAGQRVLLRISNVSVTQFSTLATNGIPMRVVALDARLLRDDAGHDLSYQTHSLTLGGGQSADVILDTTGFTPGSTYFLYTTNLHQLANDAENFGGLMTEIRIK